MRARRYSAEFRDLAIEQVTGRGYPVGLVAERFAISSQSLYRWLASKSQGRRLPPLQQLRRDNRQLKEKLIRVEDERDALKRAVERLVKAGRQQISGMES